MIKREPVFKYRLKLSRNEDGVTLHEFRRILKDAVIFGGLKYVSSKTWPRLAFGPGAQEGSADLCQYADISLCQEYDIEEIKTKLAPFITGGFKIETIKEVPSALCSLEVLVCAAQYKIKVNPPPQNTLKTGGRLEMIVARDVQAALEKGDTSALFLKALQSEKDEFLLLARLDALRSLEVRQMFLMLPCFDGGGAQMRITRQALFWQNPQGDLMRI